MLSIRSVLPTDHAALTALLAEPLAVLSPPDAAAAVGASIDASVQALAGDGLLPQRLLLVLTDSGVTPAAAPEAAGLLGVVSLAGHTGLDLPRASYRTGTVVHASAELKMFRPARTLLLGNDLTGCAELGCPVMAASDAAQSLQRLLVDAALLFVASHPDRFASTLVTELPGIGGRHGASPFWRGLGRHFHAGALPQDSAFFPSAARSHIARLMPKHPLYSALLGPDAEACIGRHAASAQALAEALQSQGLRARGQVNLFDAGPLLEAEVADLGASRDSEHVRVVVGDDSPQAQGARACLLAPDPGSAAQPWCASLVTTGPVSGGELPLSPALISALDLAPGQRITLLPQRH